MDLFHAFEAQAPHVIFLDKTSVFAVKNHFCAIALPDGVIFAFKPALASWTFFFHPRFCCGLKARIGFV